MSAFSLDEIRAAAEVKYASTDITLSDGSVVKMRNALRLPKGEREELQGVQALLSKKNRDEEEASSFDPAPLLEESIHIVAEDKDLANQLIAEIDGDLAVLMQIFSTYAGGTELPEA